MIRLTRQYRFAASHRLHAPSLGDEANRELFGKCNNPYGHGHDYVLQISVRGKADPESGLVCRIAALDALVEEKVLRRVRDRNLNDLEEFNTLVPTTENLVAVVIRSLSDAWPAAFPNGPAIDGVRVLETRRNTVEMRAA